MADMKYAGLPGIFNIFSGKKVEGVIPGVIGNFSEMGTSNSTPTSLEGVIMGGANIATGNLDGVAVAGIINYGQRLNGFGLAGILNGIKEPCDMRGVYISGIGNGSEGGSQKGMFIAGMNHSAEQRGLFSGGVNYAEDQNGLFLSLVNYAKDTQSGVYVSGIANVQADTDNFDEKGFQGIAVSPVNYARYSSGGIQIGSINFVDESVAPLLQVGLVNVLRETDSPTFQLGLLNRCGNRTIPLVNVYGIKRMYQSIKKIFTKKPSDSEARGGDKNDT